MSFKISVVDIKRVISKQSFNRENKDFESKLINVCRVNLTRVRNVELSEDIQ